MIICIYVGLSIRPLTRDYNGLSSYTDYNKCNVKVKENKLKQHFARSFTQFFLLSHSRSIFCGARRFLRFSMIVVSIFWTFSEYMSHSWPTAGGSVPPGHNPNNLLTNFSVKKRSKTCSISYIHICYFTAKSNYYQWIGTFANFHTIIHTFHAIDFSTIKNIDNSNHAYFETSTYK